MRLSARSGERPGLASYVDSLFRSRASCLSRNLSKVNFCLGYLSPAALCREGPADSAQAADGREAAVNVRTRRQEGPGRAQGGGRPGQAQVGHDDAEASAGAQGRRPGRGGAQTEARGAVRSARRRSASFLRQLRSQMITSADHCPLRIFQESEEKKQKV